MVRYSDIIKHGIKNKKEGSTRTPIDFEEIKKIPDSSNSRILKEPEVASVPSTPPAQKDAEDIEKLYTIITDYLEEVRRQIKNDKLFDVKQAVYTITHIVETPDLIERFYQFTALSHNHNNKNYPIPHLVNVMIGALKIGTGLGYSREELIELGLSALLYDVGLFKIPEEITGKSEKLTEAEINIIKKHTEIGENILSPFQTEHPMLSRAAFEHHERENGTGYPRRLRGDEICEYAKIIGLLDTFDAMTRDRPYRKALMQYLSIKELIGAKNSPFSSKIVKAFLSEISIFPVGSYVKLNNMNIGRVIVINKTYPMKPTVKLLFDNSGEEVSEEVVIDLEKHPILYITNAVSENDFPSEL